MPDHGHCHEKQMDAVFVCTSTTPNLRRAAQVGASNELPESEELDALYDRFLIRRQVAQVRSRAWPLRLNIPRA